MKTTDFAHCVLSYLTMYLPGQAGLSENTIMAYRDTFKLLLQYAENVKGIKPERFSLLNFNAQFVTDFLDWLEQERGCCVATRNQRLAAIRAFARYARTQYPEYLAESQRIMDTRSKKKPVAQVEYLSSDLVNAIVQQIDTSDRYGRRDMLLICLLYDSAARVQEICDLRVRSVRLQKPYCVTLCGKGEKTRTVPIMQQTAEHLASYLAENKLSIQAKADAPLFFNHQGEKLTRAGVTYILKKYCDAARIKHPELPLKVSPHVLRHSKAMHMLQAGVNLVYIRDFLGHAHVETTEIYAKADTEMKRRALETASIIIDPELPSWTENKGLMALLNSLCGAE